ncbi:MAG: hypothetical protein EBU90_14455 [Proteobacteria bacterium]|nr:hypothetical protein [Pseudomonadota bacterium]NBP15373.1 hypothetical protein [bacterium]
MNYLIANDGNVTAVVAGEVYTFGKSHPRYDRLITHLKNNNVEYFEASYDVVSQVNEYCEGYVSAKNGKMQWDGIDMPEMFTATIMDMIQQGYPFEPMLNFLDNMSQNPSDHAIVELFEFMENKNMPITPDGHFLAYKAVKGDYKDIYSGTFDNSVGRVCEVPRSQVDSNRDNGCGKGLHVGAFDYAKSYGGIDLDDDEGGDGNKLMICKVNPRDVVSVPSDHRFQKLRCCRYEVVSEFEDLFKTVVHMTKDDISYDNLKKRNKEWIVEVTAKLDRVNKVLKKRELINT